MTPKHTISYFKIWALVTVCLIVGGVIAAVIVGLIFGLLGPSLDTIDRVMPVIGFSIAMAASYFFFRLFVSRLIVQKLTKDSDEKPAA
jgi:multisubunit Na+/H+ antiporter MnhE subunit